MTKKLKKIPKFKTLQEEADFWDTHDTTEFGPEFKAVKARVSKNLLLKGITVRFDNTTMAQLRKEASQKGIGATTLIRMWIMEKLQHI